MGSTRPDMNWPPSTHGERPDDRYPDDRYPSRYPSSMPGRYPYDRPGMSPGMYPGSDYGDRYPTSPLPDRYPSGGRPPSNYPYDRYNPDPYNSLGAGDRYPQSPPNRMPGMDRYPPPPGSVDPYYPMPPERYPMSPDRYPGMPAVDRYPGMAAVDRYPAMPAVDRYPAMPGADRYPVMPPPGYPRPGIPDTLDSKYPPPPSNRFPEDDRYGGRDPYANKDRYNPDPAPGIFPDIRNPPNRGQPIDRPPYGEPPPYNVRYPDGPDMKYPMNPYGGSRYPESENRFPVGNDRFPINIYKYGNRGRMPPYNPGMMGYVPFNAIDMDDRGYGQRPRPPYAIMVGFGQPGQPGMDNSISDTYGMPYGE